MNKQFIKYIMMASVLLLCGCQSEDGEPDPGVMNTGDVLELSISSAETIVSNNPSSRSSDIEYGRVTLFDAGDVVGVTVVGKNDKGDDVLLADNVPYKFDGEKWDVDTDSVPERRRVYFEKSMHTYIVYYPYMKKGDGSMSLDEIKAKCFPYHQDQSAEEAYMTSDPMGWSVTEPGLRKLDVTQKHLRNSIMLDPKARWKLINGETVTYQPLREALETFTLKGSDGEIFEMYHAPDSTYRYILPDQYSGDVNWRYEYRYYKFVGKCKVDGSKVGVRYVQDEVMDMGAYNSSKALELDCFCRDDDNKGYILPYDAVALLRKEKRRCIGVIQYLNHNDRDSVDYTSALGTKNCNGYVLALTDSHTREKGWRWESTRLQKVKERAGSHARSGNDTINRDWNVYEYVKIFKDYIDYRNKYAAAHPNENFPELTYSLDFEAAHSCDIYASESGPEWQKGLEAPGNTTGWFFPSDGILHHYISYDVEKLRAPDRNAIIQKRFDYIKMHTDDSAPYKQYISPLSRTIYFTATEPSMDGAFLGRYAFCLDLVKATNKEAYIYKSEEIFVRPVLLF